jgi:hypothetical protein
MVAAASAPQAYTQHRRDHWKANGEDGQPLAEPRFQLILHARAALHAGYSPPPGETDHECSGTEPGLVSIFDIDDVLGRCPFYRSHVMIRVAGAAPLPQGVLHA